MPCKACKSENLQTFDGELTITHHEPKGLDVPPVYVCRNVLICLDCGFAELVVPGEKLRFLQKRNSATPS